MIESQLLARAQAHASSYRAPQMLHLRAKAPKRRTLVSRLRAALAALKRPKEPCPC